jgi:hypothetical protein
MHSALTGVQVLVTRTSEHSYWLVHFVRGLPIVTTEKGIAMEIYYSDARSLVTFFWGFKLWYQGTCFYVWQKRKNIKTLGNLMYTRGLGYAPTYKSDSLMFRCSFYYLSSQYVNIYQIASINQHALFLSPTGSAVTGMRATNTCTPVNELCIFLGTVYDLT